MFCSSYLILSVSTVRLVDLVNPSSLFLLSTISRATSPHRVIVSPASHYLHFPGQHSSLLPQSYWTPLSAPRHTCIPSASQKQSPVARFPVLACGTLLYPPRRSLNLESIYVTERRPATVPSPVTGLRPKTFLLPSPTKSNLPARSLVVFSQPRPITIVTTRHNPAQAK